MTSGYFLIREPVLYGIGDTKQLGFLLGFGRVPHQVQAKELPLCPVHKDRLDRILMYKRSLYLGSVW